MMSAALRALDTGTPDVRERTPSHRLDLLERFAAEGEHAFCSLCEHNLVLALRSIAIEPAADGRLQVNALIHVAGLQSWHLVRETTADVSTLLAAVEKALRQCGREGDGLAAWAEDGIERLANWSHAPHDRPLLIYNDDSLPSLPGDALDPGSLS